MGGEGSLPVGEYVVAEVARRRRLGEQQIVREFGGGRQALLEVHRTVVTGEVLNADDQTDDEDESGRCGKNVGESAAQRESSQIHVCRLPGLLVSREQGAQVRHASTLVP